MIILSILVASILATVALLHFYWAFGGLYGVNSAAPIIEGKEGFKIPKALTFIVACLITSLCILAILLATGTSPFKEIISYFGYAVSFVFIVRAIGDFKYLGFFKKVYNSPFSKKDTLYFSPLCLLLGVAFLVLSK